MLLLKVSGMTCGHCVAAVTGAVKDRGEVTVQGHPDERAVRQAIVEEGYEVQAP